MPTKPIKRGARPAFVIRDYETDEEVHRVEVSSLAERYCDRIERGLLLRIDDARFYVDDAEILAAREASEPKA